MDLYAKLINKYQIEYAPQNKGSIFNYNSNAELMLTDGYKPVVFAVQPNNDRFFEIQYIESEDNIQEIINYLETEEEYQKRKMKEELQLDIDLMISNINDLDLKRIRALCEPEVRDTSTGETWLDYYNSQILKLREQLKSLQERMI